MNRLFPLLVTVMSVGATNGYCSEPPPYDETSQYSLRQMDGWTLRISDRFAEEDRELLNEALKELERQLTAIQLAVPAKAVERLRRFEIWVEVDNPQFPCMCYHHDERWLRGNGVNPDKTGHVELANARNFLSWTKQQPWMVLHELAHGYHDHLVEGGYQNEAIAGALKAGREQGRYGEVEHIAGHKRSHYAATNPMEYFAEATEAYFGKNDFYPFTRTDLEKYDPQAVDLLETLWLVNQAPVEATQPVAP